MDLADSDKHSILLYYKNARKYYARMEVADSDEHSSLLWYRIARKYYERA